MKSLKPHIAPILHNAVGGLVTALVLAIIGGVVFFIQAFRDFPVPLWAVFILVVAGVIVILALSTKLSGKKRDIEKKNEEIATLKTKIARLKDQMPISRRPGESDVDYMVRITTGNPKNT